MQTSRDKINGWFPKLTLPAAVTRWATQTSPYKAYQFFQQGDLSALDFAKLLTKMSGAERTAALALVKDYNQFKKELAASPTIHRYSFLTEEEKIAYDLSTRQKTLTSQEKQKLTNILKALEKKDAEQFSKTYELTKKIIEEFHDLEKFESSIVTIKKKYQADKVDIDEVIFLVHSKLYLVEADKKTQAPKTITYLVPVYEEFKRLNKKSQEYTGEDILITKCKQLEFLYQGCKNLSWKLCFVDDASPTRRRSIDEIKKQLQDISNQAYKNKITCLGYEDLQPEIKAYKAKQYKDKKLSELSPSEFAETSYKGGAVQCGLRYLAGACREEKQTADIIVMTDADLSTNLGVTGQVIYDCLINHSAMAIGSRRLPGSVVIGKTDERHLLSFAFNFLAHALLNVQVSDTQVGCKAITSAAVKKIHEQFNDLSMTFDVEMIRKLQDAELKITSVPTYWRDSPYESKSASQSGNMFQGLMDIFSRMYSQEMQHSSQTASMTEPKRFQQLANNIKKEPEFHDLMKLAKNQQLHFVIKYAAEIYSVLTPQAWRNFVNHFKLFLTQLAEGKADEGVLKAIFDDLQVLYQDMRSTPTVEFFFYQFKELFSVAALIYKNREYAQIIAPLILGESLAGRIFSKLKYYNLIDAHDINKTTMTGTDETIFASWCHNGIRLSQLPKTPTEAKFENTKRQHEGWLRLAKLDKQLYDEKLEKKITLVLQYDQDGTSKEYVNLVIGEKLQYIVDEIKKNNIKSIKFELLVIDARKERNSNIEIHINKLLDEYNSKNSNVSGRQFMLSTTEKAAGKATAIRNGMNIAIQDGSAVIGYIDFSNKIPIADIAHLAADVLEGNPASIGSRRLAESEVLNKPLTFLIRSLGLNLAVKSLFPELFNLSDTQTGFKCFSNNAWKAIATELKSTSLAFDVEILVALKQHGFDIIEHPVTFNDNSMDNTDFAGPSNEMLPDLLRIRARFQKPILAASTEQPQRLGAGAEHTVYDLGDGTVLKIPTQFAAPNFMIALKHLILNRLEDVAFEDRETSLFISKFNALLNSKYLQSYIPLMRDITDINVFVMRFISALENKVKSFDMKKVLFIGKDLVGPFEFSAPFSVKIEQKSMTFDERHQVKRSKKAERVFKDAFLNILQQTSFNADEKKLSSPENIIRELKLLIDQAVELFKAMWRRGLFDLDTNIISDLGFFKADNGDVKLMCLDPGEVTDDLSLINIGTARALLPKRSDVLLMRTTLSACPEINADAIVEHYLKAMNTFYNSIEKDMQLPAHERDFGSDVRNNPKTDFRIQCSFPQTLSPPKNSKERFIDDELSEFLAAGYQLPFTKKPLNQIPENFSEQSCQLHLLVNSSNHNTYEMKNADITTVERGGILPVCSAIEVHNWLNAPGNVGILFDAGGGTRTGLLALNAGSKGQIKLCGRSFNEYAAEHIQQVAKTLTANKLNDYVILASCDDLFNADMEFPKQVVNYFKLKPTPSAFWCDLPNSGKLHMPLTQDDTIAFLTSPFVQERVNEIFSSIPFSKGYAQAGVLTKAVNSLNHLYQLYKNQAPEEKKVSAAKTSSPTIPGVSELVDRYSKLLQWQAMKDENTRGIKKPFLMILSKSFLQDFINDIARIIPEYAKTHITWENLLLRGMKSDMFIWQALGKPPHVNQEQWNNVYIAIQKIKSKHHIDTNDVEQNHYRGNPPTWQSLDDPYALMTTARRILELKPHFMKQFGDCKFLSDNASEHEAKNQSFITAKVKIVAVSLGSDLRGTIEIQYPPGMVNTHKYEEQLLLYKVTLSDNQKLKAIPGHVVTQLNGKTYSMSLKPLKENALNNQSVYEYDLVSGEPKKIHLKFKAFNETIRELFSNSSNANSFKMG